MLKKVVYAEPDFPPRIIIGELTEETDFFRITNKRGEFVIAKKLVLVVKNAGGQE